MQHHLKDQNVDQLRALRQQWLSEGCSQYRAIRAAVIAKGSDYRIRSRIYKLCEEVIPGIRLPVSALAYREENRFAPAEGRWYGRESLVVTAGEYMFKEDKYRKHLLCNLAFLYSVNQEHRDFRYENIYKTNELLPIMENNTIFVPGAWSEFFYKRGENILITDLTRNNQETQDERERLSLIDQMLSGLEV